LNLRDEAIVSEVCWSVAVGKMLSMKAMLSRTAVELLLSKLQRREFKNLITFCSWIRESKQRNIFAHSAHNYSEHWRTNLISARNCAQKSNSFCVIWVHLDWRNYYRRLWSKWCLSPYIRQKEKGRTIGQGN